MLFWGRECSLDPAGDCPRDVMDGFANVHGVVLADKLTNVPFYVFVTILTKVPMGFCYTLSR